MNDDQTRTISTKRGKITINPDGSIDGLWQVVRRELRTNEEVRKLCGGVMRKTLIAWRAKDFPEPVVTFSAASRALELWSRTEVEAWFERHRG